MDILSLSMFLFRTFWIMLKILYLFIKVEFWGYSNTKSKNSFKQMKLNEVLNCYVDKLPVKNSRFSLSFSQNYLSSYAPHELQFICSKEEDITCFRSQTSRWETRSLSSLHIPYNLPLISLLIITEKKFERGTGRGKHSKSWRGFWLVVTIV